jgi:hypothetical protein
MSAVSLMNWPLPPSLTRPNASRLRCEASSAAVWSKASVKCESGSDRFVAGAEKHDPEIQPSRVIGLSRPWPPPREAGEENAVQQKRCDDCVHGRH